jgi:hypothetical protein
MPKPVKYKRPRKINPVSVTLVAMLGLLVYLTYQYLPPYLQQHEVYRVLEEHGSMLAHRKSRYKENPQAREELRRKMEGELRRIGVMDAGLETWVEVEEGQAWLGAAYSETITWAFDIVSPHVMTYEVEHAVALD